MGLFDTIEDRLFCPFCGKVQDKECFQTKDLGQNMSVWTIEKIRKFRTGKREDDVSIGTLCKFCKKWIEIIIRGEKKVVI